MALENKTVLENLTKQREEIISQIETARTTLLKLDGAIDVLTQIEEANAEEAEETAAPAETEVVEETYE
jgi:hypothetical protein